LSTLSIYQISSCPFTWGSWVSYYNQSIELLNWFSEKANAHCSAIAPL
jgi:hypothetical protein